MSKELTSQESTKGLTLARATEMLDLVRENNYIESSPAVYYQVSKYIETGDLQELHKLPLTLLLLNHSGDRIGQKYGKVSLHQIEVAVGQLFPHIEVFLGAKPGDQYTILATGVARHLQHHMPHLTLQELVLLPTTIYLLPLAAVPESYQVLDFRKVVSVIKAYRAKVWAKEAAKMQAYLNEKHPIPRPDSVAQLDAPVTEEEKEIINLVKVLTHKFHARENAKLTNYQAAYFIGSAYSNETLARITDYLLPGPDVLLKCAKLAMALAKGQASNLGKTELLAQLKAAHKSPDNKLTGKALEFWEKIYHIYVLSFTLPGYPDPGPQAGE